MRCIDLCRGAVGALLLGVAGPAVAQLLDRAAPVALPAVIRPSQTWHQDEASAERGRNGHFMFEASVNGAVAVMMFDTGASHVILRAEDAPRLGIDMGALRWSMSASTANGVAKFAPVVVKTLTIGAITRTNVTGAVAEAGKLGHNLLGQSFLSRLSGYRLDGRQLVLRGGG